MHGRSSWVTGTSYGIIAPLTNGLTSIVDEAEVRDAERWYGITRPGCHGLVHGTDRHPHDDEVGLPLVRRRVGKLRFLASVGEPLNPKPSCGENRRSAARFTTAVADRSRRHRMIANYAAMDVRPGSMGRPLPSIKPPS
ncbi:MAG: hypothetical protein MRJ92_01635 [Nitrospira sp.]|nr:hypothetical protein [Nitrospira sp.]